MSIGVAQATRIAYQSVGGLHPRWEHLSAVGECAERLAERCDLVTPGVVLSAWLHDVGYGPAVRLSGFHPLDGAHYLTGLGVPDEVVKLVAWHTGAEFEAETRGLSTELSHFGAPDAQALDLLTMIDLAVSPTGEPILDVDRVAEMLRRYEDTDPVHRAVVRSRSWLLAASARGKAAAGLPDDWPISRSQGVGDALTHRGV